MTVIGPTNLDPSDLGPIPVDSPDVLTTEADRSDIAFTRLVVNEALYSSIPSHLYADPRITNIDPASGVAGAVVTIWGYALQGATGVTFGGVAATNLVLESNRDVKCTVPAHAPGSVPVVITTPQGASPPHSWLYTAEVGAEADTGEVVAGQDQQPPLGSDEPPPDPAPPPDSGGSASGGRAPTRKRKTP